MFWEILGERGGGKKSQFKKGSDWWKFSILNRVMGSQPIRIQLEKMLRENVAGNSCGKISRKNLVGNSVGNLAGNSIGNLAGNSCGKILQEILVRKCFGKILWDRVEGKRPI